ncbi:hypothetical protein BGZ73_006774 [Actinomortierella ambigua]|nr:hypothetical protein BGZ73_006774 [Actinomortierella ambigua]
MQEATIQTEIKFLKRLRHKHIIQFYHDHEQDGRLYLIMDLAEMGSLANQIVNSKLDWPTKTRLAHEIARGLQYIHGEDVLHRDLKSANVLLTKHMEVKLCDFGFATIGSVTATQTGSTMGTLRWLAPELLSTRPKYSTKSDIYALGMVMWEMAANCTKPFKDHSNDVMIAVLVEQGSREELPEDTPPEYRKWVERCWSHDRNLRPEASEVILVRAKPEFEYRENDIAPISATDAGDDTLVATLNALNGLMDKSKTDRTNRKGYGATGPKASASSNDTIVGRIPSIRKAAAGNTPGSTTPSSTRRSNESTASNTLINNNPPNSTRRSNDSNAGNTPNSKPPTSTPRNGVLINNNAQGTTPPMTNPRSSSLQNGNPLNGSPLRATPDKTLSNLEARARRPLSRDLLSLDVGTLTRMIEQRDKALSNVVDRYHKAAAGGDTEAQTILGWAYDNGRGVTQNGATAALWYRRAADSGSVEAQVNLGSLYLSGRGVAQSDAEAATWYRRAARSGSTTAQINLAWMYESGLGVKQDYAEAVAWYRKAADKGESAAQQRLGEMYSKGIGVTQSDSEAAYWFRQAAGQRK